MTIKDCVSDTSCYLSLFTKSKGDLFALSEALTDSLPQKFLESSDSPVIFTVDGEYVSGKKIFPDASRQRLYKNGEAELTGKLSFDEVWLGKGLSGQPLEFRFINALESNGFSEEFLEWMPIEDMVTYYKNRRRVGGVTFYHNCAKFSADSDIRIWIETEQSSSFPGSRMSSLSDIFKQEVFTDEWSRYIGLEIKSKRLLNDKSFMSVIDTFRNAYMCIDMETNKFSYADIYDYV